MMAIDGELMKNQCVRVQGAELRGGEEEREVDDRGKVVLRKQVKEGEVEDTESNKDKDSHR